MTVILKRSNNRTSPGKLQLWGKRTGENHQILICVLHYDLKKEQPSYHQVHDHNKDKKPVRVVYIERLNLFWDLRRLFLVKY